MEEAARTAGLPVSVVAAQLQQESDWNPNAASSAGAQGIAQFMPETWATYGERRELPDPEDAIPAYGRYMAALRNEVKSLAGDDAGRAGASDPGRLQRRPRCGAAAPGCAAVRGDPAATWTRSSPAARSSSPPGCEAPTGGKAWDGDLGDGEWTTPLPGGEFTSGYGGRTLAGVPGWANQHGAWTSPPPVPVTAAAGRRRPDRSCGSPGSTPPMGA